MSSRFVFAYVTACIDNSLLNCVVHSCRCLQYLWEGAKDSTFEWGAPRSCLSVFSGFVFRMGERRVSRRTRRFCRRPSCRVSPPTNCHTASPEMLLCLNLLMPDKHSPRLSSPAKYFFAAQVLPPPHLVRNIWPHCPSPVCGAARLFGPPPPNLGGQQCDPPPTDRQGKAV